MNSYMKQGLALHKLMQESKPMQLLKKIRTHPGVTVIEDGLDVDEENTEVVLLLLNEYMQLVGMEDVVYDPKG